MFDPGDQGKPGKPGDPGEIKKVDLNKRPATKRVVTQLPAWNNSHVKTMLQPSVETHSQLEILARLLHPQCDTDISPECVVAFREIRRKQIGYQMQDKKKNRAYSGSFRIADILRILHDSGLRCHYCNQPVCVLYEDRLYPMQWTLDRRDNFKSHDIENVVVSCLSCNLKRRCQNHKKFKVSKTFSHIRRLEAEEDEVD
jgi:hypothetical protein